jgi:hypothetical protein
MTGEMISLKQIELKSFLEEEGRHAEKHHRIGGICL